jgi:SagB-type dehydrogenase family enzyme
MDDLKKSLGYKYLQDTKFDSQTIRRQTRPEIYPAEPYKRYPDLEKTALPTDWKRHGNLYDALQNRRSNRRYGDAPLSLQDLAMLLWAGQGVTGRAGSYFFRAAPSAGALYPIETYLAINDVESVTPGLYHFQVLDFSLTKLSSGFPGAEVAQAALDQSFLAQAGVVFIWSAILRRNFAKYGHRGLRYVLMDAGHICQNVLLAAAALELGACPVAAFYDNDFNRLLDLDGEEESVVYLASVGSKP